MAMERQLDAMVTVYTNRCVGGREGVGVRSAHFDSTIDSGARYDINKLWLRHALSYALKYHSSVSYIDIIGPNTFPLII